MATTLSPALAAEPGNSGVAGLLGAGVEGGAVPVGAGGWGAVPLVG